MTNSVTVTEAYGAGAEGNYLFAAVGSLMTDANVAIVTPVVQGVLDPAGNLTATLLASDNFSPGELNWSCFIEVQGLSRIHFIDFPVTFGLGASQNLYTILSAAGWTPTAL